MKKTSKKTTSKKPQNSTPLEKSIIDFFKSLSTREKMLISTYQWMQSLDGCIAGGFPVAREVGDLVDDFDEKEITKDKDLGWLHGVRQLAQAACNRG